MKWFQGTADAVRQFIWVFEDAKNKNVEHVLILSGDHLYRMNYMEFVQKHIDTNADVTVSCVPMDDSRASDYGLMKIDNNGRIVQFAEKPKGPDLKAMGVYVFRTDVLLKLLRWSYPSCNDFRSEIIPSAVKDHNVQPCSAHRIRTFPVRFLWATHTHRERERERRYKLCFHGVTENSSAGIIDSSGSTIHKK
ncbi:glucose-1-phosphate adenylyltransferase [Salix suchowensis]|nr:glucose-1-phosphate adenylyltransferase [Salix suchowensis]